jgi:hypothetical protein
VAAFLRSRLGSALLGAVAIVIGVAVAGSFGWTEPPTASTYALGAVAGLAGGYVGAMLRERQEAD